MGPSSSPGVVAVGDDVRLVQGLAVAVNHTVGPVDLNDVPLQADDPLDQQLPLPVLAGHDVAIVRVAAHPLEHHQVPVLQGGFHGSSTDNGDAEEHPRQRHGEACGDHHAHDHVKHLSQPLLPRSPPHDVIQGVAPEIALVFFVFVLVFPVVHVNFLLTCLLAGSFPALYYTSAGWRRILGMSQIFLKKFLGACFGLVRSLLGMVQ